ncbi:MAG: ABC transporter permease [Bacteroidetes bacterium]|nr:ABC transporter permease [Bacteroidota bacterium]
MYNLFRQGQFFQLLSAQFKELIREPGVLFWGIVFPILMSLGLGIAFTQKPDITRKVAVIERNGIDSTIDDTLHVIETFLQSNTEKIISGNNTSQYKLTIPDDKLGNTTFLFQKTSWKDAIIRLKRGNLNLVIDEKDGEIQYHFDPLNPDAQLTYLKLSDVFSRRQIKVNIINENIIPLTVSGTRYIDFLVPGLIAMGVMMSSMWGISWGIIEKRSKKLLRRLVATPMKKSYFLITLISVRVAMNFVESALLFLFANIVFGITVQGSVAGLLIIFITGNIAFAGIAIFISSHTSKTEIGNGFINVVVMPMMVLSGIFFSYHNFPEWSIPIIQKLPLTMLADGLRSVFIEGADLRDISGPSLFMAATGVIFFSAGLKIFKWH